ncbi:MAG: DUF2933 domain-containing protein [Alphaproteobacteria bacterium]
MSKDQRDIEAMNTMQDLEPRTRLKFGSKFVLAAFLAVAAIYLITEHAGHALAALPYLLFLLCPLMHVFMHRGGHGGGHSGSHGGPPSEGTHNE